jgi:hypothetical protein
VSNGSEGFHANVKCTKLLYIGLELYASEKGGINMMIDIFTHILPKHSFNRRSGLTLTDQERRLVMGIKWVFIWFFVLY